MPAKKQKGEKPPQTNSAGGISFEIPAPPLTPTQDNASLPSYAPPQESEAPLSYFPPQEPEPQTPTAPLSSKEEKASSTKSKPVLTPPKTSPTQSRPHPCVEPPKHPSLGTGGIEYIVFAAETFDDEKFKAYYEHRADHLIVLHAGAPGAEAALARLESLIPQP